MKGGYRTPNLELEGDMLDALTFETTSSGITVGIFEDSGQADKADGHNNFSGKSKLPLRRFIPKSDEEFKGSINTGVRQILNRYKRADDKGSSSFEALSLASAALEPDLTIDDILKPFLLGDLFG